MLRDLRASKRKKSNLEEIENVPVNLKDSSVISSTTDATRAPLNTIAETSLNAKSVSEQESGTSRSKVAKTPSKVQGKGSSSGWSLRTPEKQGLGFSARTKFGWGQKNDTGKSGAETGDEGTTEVIHNLYQLQSSSRGASHGNGGLPNVTPRSVRTTRRYTPSHSECSSTQTTPTKSITKPSNMGVAPSSVSRPPMGVGPRLGNTGAFSKGISISSTPASVVNTVEVPHFELREDPSFWMDHNVQVLIRLRPLNNMERSLHGYNRCLKQESAQSISWVGQPEARFTFDHVACETINQDMLFRVAGLPMVENCLSGYNSCMFAYGQTGSGKTHTMLGEIADLDVKPSPNRGMTPRIFEFLCARIRAEEESRRDEKLTYNCKCSFLEIYNEQITDLLDPSCTNLHLREDMQKGVYVENLTEFEVQTVNDILTLLTQGAANRKVAATNMNRESSRSHSVFTCVIESRWEKDSTTNLRFARLNLVDLAGSERQKTSGAEGERLKEAASINKSLSTLGHVIMVLVDVAQGKHRHIPYRDSRLTFLLQDSLGGNSKTMIIANVSPSICSAAETLSTLKFAQRAKLIQNNAIVNEDASGDVIALQHQIRLLKEELAVLKRQNISRSLSFRSAIFGEADEQGADVALAHEDRMPRMVLEKSDDSHKSESLGIVRLSTKQMKSLETTLTGALRREQMADTSTKQLEAEIEQLNRLVRQREEDTQCTKMMLKFREDKIQRIESLVGDLIPPDKYLFEENTALSEELRMVRVRVDRNPEVTRFALENIRLLEKLRKFQDFYEEGEREILLAEVSELRDQLLQFLNEHSWPYNNQNPITPSEDVSLVSREHDPNQFELTRTQKELEDCRNSLNSCLEMNVKLTREIEDLHSELNNHRSSHDDHNARFESCEESLVQTETFKNHLHEAVEKEKETWKHENIVKHTEEIMNLQLELDILKVILQEERSSCIKVEERASCLSNDLEIAKESNSHLSTQLEEAMNELKNATSVIEALESQQILSMDELDDIKSTCNNYLELLSKKEREIFILKEELHRQELRSIPSFKHSNDSDSSMQEKLKGMHDSLEKVKRLNSWYKSDRAFQASNEQETEEVRRQVEAETAEVIVRLQEELVSLQQQVHTYSEKEVQSKETLMMLEKEKEDLKEMLYLMTQENERSQEHIKKKDVELSKLSDECERLAFEIEEAIYDGHESLKDASDQVTLISCSFPQRTLISEHVGRMIKTLSEKKLLIAGLQRSLEEAQTIRSDMELKLKSLRGAALAITEAQQQESREKEKEVFMLTSQLGEKTSMITELEKRIKTREKQINKAEICATVGFVIVKRLSEKNTDNLDALEHRNNQLYETIALNQKKDALCIKQISVIKQAEQEIQALRLELEYAEERCASLKSKLLEEEESVRVMERKLVEVENSDILKTKEKLDEFKVGISTLSSCMNTYTEQDEGSQAVGTPHFRASSCQSGVSEGQAEIETCEAISKKESYVVGNGHKDVCDKDRTIILLKKEVESALVSLREVQAQMDKLLAEKEEIRESEIHSRKGMECITAPVLMLQAETDTAAELSNLKIAGLDQKFQKIEERVKEVKSFWFQEKEMLETELLDSRMMEAQKTAEVSSLLAKLEEAQETMYHAEMMVNALMAKNETSKLEIERLKKLETTLTNEKDSLIHEIQSLQSSSAQKDQQYDNLERQLSSELSEMRSIVVELEDTITELQAAYKAEFGLVISDFQCLKSQILNSTDLTRSWLEDIWSEIIAKDCAVSVLHLCYMGVLLEAVNGINAENGLLHHGLCESNSVIADLKEHNFKSQKELEMCRILKGKLLVDIKNSFDRISRKEDETGKFSAKLSDFEKKIMDLQLQEELMLTRSKSMGSELALLMKDLELNNVNSFTALLHQEKLLKDKEELDILESTAKGFESLILASELKEMGVQKAALDRQQGTYRQILENIKKEIIYLKVEAEVEKQLRSDMEVDVAFANKVVEETVAGKDILLRELEQCGSRLAETDELNKALVQDIESLREVSCINDKLRDELEEVREIKEILSSQVQELKSEISTIQDENENLEIEIKKVNDNYCQILEDFQEQKSEIETSCTRMEEFNQEKNMLQNKISTLETYIVSLQTDRDTRDKEFETIQHSQSIMVEELNSKSKDLEIHVQKINSLREENGSLRSKLMSNEQDKDRIFTMLTLKAKSCSDSFHAVNMTGNKIVQVINDKNIVLLDQMFSEICDSEARVSKFIEECECLEKFARDLISENLYLQTELSRKDEVLKGLSFDISLLQESASNAKDQKDELLQMMGLMEGLENDHAFKSSELEEAATYTQKLEVQLQEKSNLCSILEMDISIERESLKLLRSENVELRAQMEDIFVAKGSIEEEVVMRSKVAERLEEEIFQMDSTLSQTNTLLDGLKNDLNKVTTERDQLNYEVLALKEKLESAQTLAEENEAVAVEAREIAESRRNYAEEKEEEVKLLERSVEELESTVDVLENKVDIVKGEAERQRLEREELEMELQSIRNQMQSIMSEDAVMHRSLEEKETDLREARQQIKDLEKNITDKDAEIIQCRAHISELNLHADAQAREYKQKFKALEAMAESVKPEPASTHFANSLSTKPEKNAVKSRGSGSPFKCIGLGLAQQMNSEKDEELTAGRHRIEELEALAANRQKEIFMLNARLAAAESMTHDVIRDLLGVKLDMTNYASLLDHQQVQRLTEKARPHGDESVGRDQEVVKLKQQLHEFIEERQAWLEEINRRHAEMVALQATSENLRRRDHLLSTENDVLKMENVNHKKRVIELEVEVKKLSGQQNLQQRIHHHAKIKNPERDFVVKISALEIYNETVINLLNRKSGPLRLLDDAEKGIFVEKLVEEVAQDCNHLKSLIGICEAQRQVGETALNDTSSRSHQIIKLTVESCLRENSGHVKSFVASLNLVDLAGSERASQTKVDGIRLKEGSHINRSLLTLMTVIRKLSDGRKSGHIPYRDSKLTRILQPSLGGNSRTAIICTMSPALSHKEQSRNTLSFATRAKEVTNKAQVNMVVLEQQLVKHLQKEVARLEAELQTPVPSSSSCLKSLLVERDMKIQKMMLEMENLKRERDIAQSELQLERKMRKKLKGSNSPDSFCQVVKCGSFSTESGPLLGTPTFPYGTKTKVGRRRNAMLRQSITSAEPSMLVHEIRKLEQRQRLLGEEANRALEVLHKEVSSHRLGNQDAAETIAKLLSEIKEMRIISSVSDDDKVGENTNLKEEISRLNSDGITISTLEKQLENAQKSIDKLMMLLPSNDRIPECKLEIVKNRSTQFPLRNSTNKQHLLRSPCTPLSSSRNIRNSEQENLSPQNEDHVPAADTSIEPCKSTLKRKECNGISSREGTPGPRCPKSVNVKRMQEMFKNAAEENIRSIRAYVTELKERVAKLQYQKQLLVCQVLELEENETSASETGVSDQSPMSWSLVFEDQRKQIIMLWHLCHVSIVRRSQFYLLFRGDPDDQMYMEVELRRLTWLEQKLAEVGNASPALLGDEPAGSVSSSIKALKQERENLAKRVTSRLTVEELEMLYIKWEVPPGGKQRRLQLVNKLWTDPHNMEHVRESAEVVAKLVGFCEPGEQITKEMFELNFVLPSDKKPWMGWNLISNFFQNL